MPQADQQTNPFLDFIQSLMNKAQPRPDLITPGSTGTLENARPATFAGRVTTGGETPMAMLSRAPIESPDAEGISGVMLSMTPKLAAAMAKAPDVMTAMAKVFKPGPQSFAKLAKTGELPVTAIHKMWPALIDETRGEVIHAMAPGIGMHNEMWKYLPKSFTPTRGFVDPETFKAYTDKMLESIYNK